MKKTNKFLIYFLITFVINVSSNQTNHIQTIYLGSGCFWGAEKGYEALDGVIDAESGYANGYGIKPNYRSIIQFKNKYKENNFAEVVKVTFNSNAITLNEILKHFFETHDPTQLNRQGNDIGTQYRSTILFLNENQKKVALEITKEYQNLLYTGGYGKVKTKIEPLDNFYLAEDYHQDYLVKNPNGYCPDNSTGIIFSKETEDLVDNKDLTSGKKILVLDAEDCPYCFKLRKEVLNSYEGSIELFFRKSKKLVSLNYLQLDLNSFLIQKEMRFLDFPFQF